MFERGAEIVAACVAAELIFAGTVDDCLPVRKDQNRRGTEVREDGSDGMTTSGKKLQK